LFYFSFCKLIYAESFSSINFKQTFCEEIYNVNLKHKHQKWSKANLDLVGFQVPTEFLSKNIFN